MWKMSVEEAVAELISARAGSRRPIYIASLFRFFCWLEKSQPKFTETNEAWSLYFACIVAFRNHDPAAGNELLLEFIDWAALFPSLLNDGLFSIHVREPDLDDEGRVIYELVDDDFLAAAHIVEYFIRSQKPRPDRRRRPSLNKAQCYLYGGRGLQHLQMRGPTKFDEIWRNYKKTAIFHYTQEFHFPHFWSLDPRKDIFKERVEYLISSPEVVQTYFETAHWVQDVLRQYMDPRAMYDTDYFEFPAGHTAKEKCVSLLAEKDVKRIARCMADRKEGRLPGATRAFYSGDASR